VEVSGRMLIRILGYYSISLKVTRTPNARCNTPKLPRLGISLLRCYEWRSRYLTSNWYRETQQKMANGELDYHKDIVKSA
jgi:hypothetical protein